MNLVPATDQDFEFCRQVHHSAYRDMVTRQFGTWEEPVQDRFFEQTWNRHPHTMIRNSGDEPCGYCAIERDHTRIRLCEIAILPEHQGNGIGSEIIRALISEADQKKIPVKLNVMKSNAGARRLYDRLGFRPIGEIDTHDLMQWVGAPS